MNQYEYMTETPVKNLIMKLSVPTIISMLITNVYNLVDTAFVGQLGTSASGAVGIVFGFMAILQALGFMCGQGSGSIVSRLLGQRDAKTATSYASTGVFMGLILGAILTVVGFLFLEPLIYFLGSTDTILPFAKEYITYILIASPFMVCSFVLNNLLRYEGKASFGMIGLLVGSILNIAGDALFMFVLDMGISGAGLSTAISQTISFLVLLSPFLRGKTTARIQFKEALWNVNDILEICACGLPSLLRQGLNALCTMLLNLCAANYGDAAIAAMSIVARVSFFVFAVGLGVGQGYQPVCGFCYGAKKYDRVRQGYRFALIMGMVMISILGGIVLAFSDDVIGLFRDDPEVIKIGTRALFIQICSMIVMPFGTVTEMSYQVTGHKLGASLQSALRSGLCYIPILFILYYFRGLAGIQETQAVAYVVATIPSIFFARWFFKNLDRLDEENKGSDK